ncbi:MAG: exodeoxyribonuclease VII small subunit [Ignavibacteriaceae bacterium]|jgi:exodeoxyribonuclease VII small subunit|nr:exodeoxyribonuclease VII small subunit [Ignavibacteriaceae bacterium]
MTKKKDDSFESRLNRLEEISGLLENNQTSLDDSIKLYEEGINLAKICFTTLKDAELKVVDLKKQLEQNFEGNS